MKYILYCITLLLIPISFLFKRNRKKWAFGSNLGFTNNAKYFFLYVSEIKLNDCIFPLWISSNREEASYLRALGLNAFYRWSLKGVYHALTSKIWIYDSYVSDINLFAFGNSTRINLWHGVGIKKIEYQITSGPLYMVFHSSNLITKIKNLYFFIKPTYFLTTSQMMKEHFSNAFRIQQSKCIDGFYPRCAILLENSFAARNFIERYEPVITKQLVKKLCEYNYVYLYMPTWRDAGENFLDGKNWNFDRINQILSQKSEFLIIKMHPNTHIRLSSQYSNIAILDKNLDVYPLLPFTNCLITDFSSIYYDYILMKHKQIILYLPDYSNYIAKDRDLAFDYDKYTIGEKIYTFEDLLSAILDHNSIKSTDSEDISSIRKFFWGENNLNLKDLYQRLKCTIS